jgi:hypothetical protein
LIQRVVESGVALIDELQERLQDVGMRGRCVKEHAEPIEQRACASDRPCIEQRQQELGVVGLETSEVVQFTHLMADDHTKVPQRIEELAQELLFVGTDATAEQHQQIDVRLQTQVPPAVAAQGKHRDMRVRRHDVGAQLQEHRVDTI